MGGAFFFSVDHAAALTGHEEVYYEGDAGLDDRWGVREETPGVALPGGDPAGASVTEVYDGAKGHDVLRTSSPNGPNGMDNSYQLYAYDLSLYDSCGKFSKYGDADRYANCINNNRQEEFTMEIKSSGMFAVYVYAHSTDVVEPWTDFHHYNSYRQGAKMLKYTPEDINMGGAAIDWNCAEREFNSWGYAMWYSTYYNPGVYPDLCSTSNSLGKNYHYGLGSNFQDGNWHTISRNIADDLETLAPGDTHLKTTYRIFVVGNVRIDKVALDFDSETFALYEDFQKDPNWAYDTGWLDMHDGGDNPAGKVQCLPTSGYITDCKPEYFEYNNCRGVYKWSRSDYTINASDLPNPVMNDCYITMFNDYTYDGTGEGVQPNEVTAILVDTGSEITTATLPDPGEGGHVINATEPITLRKGVNTFYTAPPGYCGVGNSVHNGRTTRGRYGLFGIENKGLDAIRIRCRPNANALTLDFRSAGNPIIQTTPETVTAQLLWNTNNAKRCEATGGYFDGINNDWQDMTPAWTDLQTGNPAWPAWPAPPAIATTFTTNPLPYEIGYTLKCYDTSDTRHVTETETISVIPAICMNDATCTDFVWQRARSRNDAGNDNRYDDPLGHPSNVDVLDASGNPVPPADNDTSFEPAYNLSAGSHTLYIKHRETSTTFDKILITSDLGYVPTGLGGTGPVGDKIWIEAEDYTYKRTWSGYTRVKQNYTAAEFEFLEFYYWMDAWLPSTYYTLHVRYAFVAPVAGRYVVWGRVGTLNPGGNGNGVWLGIDADLNPALVPPQPDDKYDFVLWDTLDHGDCCMKIDFWGGAEADKGTMAGTNPAPITLGTPIRLWWETGQMDNVLGEMNSGFDIDYSWLGTKPADETPYQASTLPTPPPPPSYNSQTVTPPAVGTYKYILYGMFNGGMRTDPMEVTVVVNPAVPPVIDGICGEACHETHCNEPASGFCTAPSTLESSGIHADATGWYWVCEGTSGIDADCRAERECGWVEK